MSGVAVTTLMTFIAQAKNLIEILLLIPMSIFFFNSYFEFNVYLWPGFAVLGVLAFWISEKFKNTAPKRTLYNRIAGLGLAGGVIIGFVGVALGFPLVIHPWHGAEMSISVFCHIIGSALGGASACFLMFFISRNRRAIVVLTVTLTILLSLNFCFIDTYRTHTILTMLRFSPFAIFFLTMFFVLRIINKNNKKSRG